jgi:MoaA/NifB/PqqE/SkfB family radical SAM enzyme
MIPMNSKISKNMSNLVYPLAKRILPPRVYNPMIEYYRQITLRYLSKPFFLFPRYQYPSFLSIYLTTRCNLRCFICRREEHKGEELEFENIYKLENAIKYAYTIDLTGWGEVTLYPRFEDVLRYIFSVNPKRELLYLTTNGTRLSESLAHLLNGHLKTLIISLNAATADTYNRDMKGGDFEKTLTAIRSFINGLHQEERPKLSLHFVAHANNFREIPKFIRLAHSLGIPHISVGHYLVGRADHTPYSLLYVKEEYNAIIAQARSIGEQLGVAVWAREFFKERPDTLSRCMSPFKECFININGNVGVCCFAGNFTIGNVYEHPFEEVWFGEAYRKLRKTRYLPACRKCTPFIPLDDYQGHFHPNFKEQQEFEALKQQFESGMITDPV